MTMILCATKDGKVWHITKDKVKTLCGKEKLDSFAEVKSLENLKTVCPQCLKKH